MKKSKKIILGVLGVLALVGICFACLSVYAKKEINKPRFELPETVAVVPPSELPNDKDGAYDYVSEIFEKTVSANDVEITRHTEVRLTEGEIKTPFSEDDNKVLSRVLEKSQDALGELYPADENAPMAQVKDKPALGFTKADVSDFTAELGYTDENGEYVDDGIYYITLTVNPACVNKNALLESEVRKNIEKELSPVLSVSSLDIVPDGFTLSFKFSNYNDMLTYAEIKHHYTVKAAVDFTEDYKAVSDKTAEVEIPYETTEKIDFFNYGIHFTERQIAIQKKDVEALPLEVRVNSETTKDDYKLTFDISKDGILEIDTDGVMTANGAQEEPVYVTAKLEYNGHTYTDTLIVYATELEVKTDEQTE